MLEARFTDEDEYPLVTPCACCVLAPADPTDPNGFCIECSIECADSEEGDE